MKNVTPKTPKSKCGIMPRVHPITASRLLDLPYEQLLAEGYVYSVEGPGTYVSGGIKFEIEHTPLTEIPETRQFLYEEVESYCNFRTGVPDLRYVPIDIWVKLYKQAVHKMDFKTFDYHNPMGYQPLRSIIADYLKKWRGIQADSSQIVITSGAAQGLSLLKAFIEKESSILAENPVSTGIITTLKQFDVQIGTIEDAKYNSDIHTSLFEQVTMEAFISQGYYEKHIRKMKKLYDGKRKMIIQEIQKHFGNKVIITGYLCGLHMILDFSDVISKQDLKKAIKSAGVNI